MIVSTSSNSVETSSPKMDFRSDIQWTVPATKKKRAANKSYVRLRRAAKKNPPPQTWFDETDQLTPPTR